MTRLLLLGAGHAQLAVLAALARRRIPGAEVVLVSPNERFIYSGMVPGLIAGRFDENECSTDVASLAAAGGVSFLRGRAAAIDAEARCVTLADGQRIEYDVLSLDTGGTQDRDRLPGARDNALFLRPMEGFVELWQRTLALATERELDVVVIGNGAAGVEIALALRRALAARCSVSLVSDGELLPAHGPAVRRRALDALQFNGVQLLPGRCTAIEPWHVRLGALRVACDVPILAVGSDAPSWLAGSALALDAQGFVRIGATLQSASHPNVFAAGDVIVRDDHPHPRSGVYAVRAGPVLAANLRRFIVGAPLKPYRPQRRSLYLISLADGRAIASWAGWSVQGRAIGRWKDRIDRAFIARYSKK
ncbi:MAG: FAD-dependent oxidoreductase [Burkholderiaceae bacterium]